MKRETEISKKWKVLFSAITHDGAQLTLSPKESETLINDIEEVDDNYYKRYRDLEADVTNEFNSIKKTKKNNKIFITEKEDLEELGWENTFTLVNSYSGENVDFYPLSILKDGSIDITRESGEIENADFNELTLYSKIELCDLLNRLNS